MSARITSTRVAGVALFLGVVVSGCSGSGPGAAGSAEAAAEQFADAVAAGDATALCAASAVAGQPAADDPNRSALCERLLSSVFLDLPDTEREAFKDADAVVTVDGKEASVELAGADSRLTVTEIDGAWYVVVG